MDLSDFYREAVENLKRQAQQHEDLGEFDEWTAALQAAEKLEEWLAEGMQAPLDLDLAEFGIAPPGEAMDEAGEIEAAQVEQEDAPDQAPPAGIEEQTEEGEPQAEQVLPETEELVSTADEQQPVELTVEVEEGEPQDEPTPDVQPEAAVAESGTVQEMAVEQAESALQEEAEALPEPEELPYERLEEETPEQQQLRREVRELRADVEAGRYSQAVPRAQVLRSRPEITPELQEQVDTLLGRAKEELNKQVATLLAEGDQALEAGDKEAARKAYGTVLSELDPDHEYARQALFRLERAEAAQLSEAQQRELRFDLQERKSIRRLGDAVYKAEALRAEGELPDEMVELLGSAREYYNQWRQDHGQETTAMRFFDLRGRKEAVDKIRQRVAAGESEIFDITVYRFRPAVEVLEEAQKLLELHSEATAQYEIDRVRAALPAYPLWARERLDQALEQPFHEHHARLLDDLRLEVDQQAEKKARAEGLLALADQSRDPLEKLGYVLRAQAEFPYLEGLQSAEGEQAPLVAQAYQTAATWLTSRMEYHKNQARLHLTHGEYQEARQELLQAEDDFSRWPPLDKPADILALKEEYDSLHEEIDTDESHRKEFNQQAKEIRRLALKASTRVAGMELYRQVRADERFQKYNELRVLVSEMDQYTDIGDLLRDLDDARKVQDWERVQELAVKINESGKAGQFAEHVTELLEEARLEIDIAQAIEYLEVDEIAKANGILDKRIRTEADDAKRLALEERLKPERAKISQCIQNNKVIQPLFNQAVELSQKRGVAERLQALWLFRFIGGGEVPHPDPDWPEYQLSLRTADARREARKVGESLRDQLIPGVLTAYQRGESLTGDEMNKLASQAQSLREAGLLESEEERAAVRWAEIEWGSQRAHAKESLGDWDGSVQIWSDLIALYPFSTEVERGLQRARIQQVINQSHGLLINDQGEAALNLLRGAQQDPALSRSWQIALTLAETHSRRGDFVQAFRALSDAERLVEMQGEFADGGSAGDHRLLISQKRQEIEREKDVQEAIARAGSEWQINAVNAREALRVLQNALGKPPTDDSRRLKDLRDEIYTYSEETLLKTARQEKGKGTDDGKIQAVAALVDLRDLEHIVQLAEEDRRSTEELDALRAELAPAARAVIIKANDFNPANLPLEQALSEVDLLVGRLQSFSSVIPLFQEELGATKENLERQRSEITHKSEHLQRLQDLLKEAYHVNLWEEALRSDSFDLLEQYQRQIQMLDLVGMLEVQNYGLRILEWKELHTRLTQDIASLKRSFEVSEEFEAVVNQIRRLRVRYDVRLDNQPWRQVHQQDYEKIFYTMGAKLLIADVHGEAQKIYLQGWDEVEQAATERGEELRTWDAWNAELDGVAFQVDQSLNKAEEAVDAPFKTRIARWQEVEKHLTVLLELLEAGPLQDGAPAGTHSQKTKRYQKERQARIQATRTRLLEAEVEIKRLTPEIEGPGKGFPAPREFDTAVKHRDWDALDRLVQRGRIVGASSSQEEKLLGLYERILVEQRNHSGDPQDIGDKPKRKWFWQKD